MRFSDLYVSGVGSWYPKPVAVTDAIADGHYDATTQQRTGQLSVAIADGEDSQPEMAVRAGALAIRQSQLSHEDFGLLLHAVAGHNGLDGWNSASFLQHRLVGGQGVAFEIRQLSNGVTGSVELVAAYLSAGTDRPAALITAADCFAEPAWDRWRLHPGLVFGDGASAVVLRGGQGSHGSSPRSRCAAPSWRGWCAATWRFAPTPTRRSTR